METKVIQLFKPKASANIVSEIFKPEIVKYSFLNVLDEYAAKTLDEMSLSGPTRVKYMHNIKNIRGFLEATNQLDITVDEIRIKTMEELRWWLQKNLHHCGLSHASRHVELCKRVMTYSVAMEYTLNNPIQPVRAKRTKQKDIVALESWELKALMSYKCERPLYVHVSDLYVFQCFTGLSYGDLYKYQLITREDGRLWIVNRRHKNDTLYYVPLFPAAKDIHDKYAGKFPIVCNQVYNKTLKKIAQLAGIEKDLTSHTGRKTFATHRDNDGFSTKTIADMLGNTMAITERYYLAKSTKRTENELARLGL